MKSLLIVFISCLSISIIAQGFESGTGTENDPYLITNPTQLSSLRNLSYTSGEYPYAALDNNIDMSLQGRQEPFDNVIITQYGHNEFSINLDGRGYIISNLAITGEGFAEKLNGTIKNLGFEDVSIEAHYPGIGIIAGRLSGGQILNCYVKNVTMSIGTASPSGRDCGALVGEAIDSTSTIMNCWSENVYIPGRANVGGLVGWLGCHLSKSVAFGGDLQISDIVSDFDEEENCIGPVVGKIEANYTLNDVYYSLDSFTYEKYESPILDPLLLREDGITPIANGVSTEDLKNEASYPGLDFETTWIMGEEHPELRIFGTTINIFLPDTVQALSYNYSLNYSALRTLGNETYSYTVNGSEEQMLAPPTNPKSAGFIVPNLTERYNTVTVIIKRDNSIISSDTISIELSFLSYSDVTFIAQNNGRTKAGIEIEINNKKRVSDAQGKVVFHDLADGNIIYKASVNGTSILDSLELKKDTTISINIETEIIKFDTTTYIISNDYFKTVSPKIYSADTAVYHLQNSGDSTVYRYDNYVYQMGEKCDSTSSTDTLRFDVNLASNIEQPFFVEITVYPNPTKDMLNINYKGDVNNQYSCQLEIYDIQGNVVYQAQAANGNTLLDLNKFGSKGLYILQVKDDSNILASKKILLE